MNVINVIVNIIKSKSYKFMEPNQNKNMWMWVAVAVVVIGIVGFLVMDKKDSEDMDSLENDQTAMDAKDMQVPDGEEDVTEGSVNVKTDATSPQVTLSYQQALEKYKDRRIQFDNSCATTPKSVTYKDNTGIMLDNRSAKTRTIKVGETYTVKAYGFKIITLPDTYLKSKTLLVDCDGQQNVATVLVQE